MTEDFDTWKARRDSGSIGLEFATIDDMMQELTFRGESVLIYLPDGEELQTYSSLSHEGLMYQLQELLNIWGEE